MQFRGKLLLSYVVLISLPLIILGTGYYYASARIILPSSRNYILQIIQKSNQILDERLAKTKDDTLMLMVECDLYQIFDQPEVLDDYGRLQADKQIRVVLNRYFSEVDGLYSVQLVTRDFVYGDRSNNTFPAANFYQSELFAAATQANGRLAWAPTYTYAEMYRLPELLGTNTEYRHLFSAVRTVTPSCVQNDLIVRPRGLIEKPILLLNFLPAIYQEVFENNLAISGAVYMVVSPDGQIVMQETDGETEMRALNGGDEWLDQIQEDKTGTAIVTVDDVQMVAGFATSPITGWTSVYLVPQSALMRDVLRAINLFTVTSLGLLLALSLLFAYLLSSRIASPIRKLLDGIGRSGVGDFDVEIPVDGRDEFGNVLGKFNSMNRKIKTLIDENYVARIREKETEILALNVQLNPHFLHNTLNTIHWMALANEQEKVSRMLLVLSRMLHYTTDNRQDITTFREDLAWLEDYLQIMKHRYGGSFEVQFEIESELMDAEVPKLFLQPIVENSVLHGFREIEEGGMITIYGKRQGQNVVFCVEDNGGGISAEELARICADDNEEEGSSESIGLQNVSKRIVLLYGREYGLTVESEAGIGTRVTVTFPYRKRLHADVGPVTDFPNMEPMPL